jgi:MFS family permease
MQAWHRGKAQSSRYVPDWAGNGKRRASLSNTKKNFYGWKLVAALWVLDFLNMGFPLYGASIINTYMLKEIIMSRSTFGMAYSLLNLAAGVPSVLIAVVIVKFGVRTTFGVGSVLILSGALWMAFLASQPWHYVVGFGVVIGAGIGFGTIVPLSTAITRWFNRYRGRAMAIAMTAPSLAGFMGAPALNKMLAANGGNWHQAWMAVAAIAVLSGVIAYLFVKEHPADLGQAVDGAPEGNNVQKLDELHTCQNWTTAEAYRTQAYWLIFIGSIACQYPFFFITAHWVLHLKGMGISSAGAAFAMGIYTLGSIMGRLVGGWLMDVLPARFVFIAGIGCTAAGAAIAIHADKMTIACPAAILMGAGFGWTFVSMNAIVGNFYGAEAFPHLMGTMFLMSAIACSPAGLVGGMLFDSYGSYTSAFVLVVAICIAAMLVLWFARMPKRKENAG